MNQFELRKLLVSMHRFRDGVSPMLRYCARQRHGKDVFFRYTHAQLGSITIDPYAVYQMQNLRWIQVQPLDAWLEYISTTELGKAIVAEYNPRLSESDWCAFLPDEAYTCWFGTPPYVGWAWSDANMTITDRREY